MLSNESLGKLEAIAKTLGLNIADTVDAVSEETMHERYDEMLDEIYPEPTVACCSVSPAKFLRDNDEIAYNVGFSDWVSEQLDEGEYCELASSYFDDAGVNEVIDYIKDILAELD